MSEIGQKTISQQVEEYIDTHTVVRNALQHGIVNYSALTRRIQNSMGTPKNFEAILIAVRRNAEKLLKIREHIETKIQKILSESSFEIKTKIAVMTLENNTDVVKTLGHIVGELSSERIHFHFIQGIGAVTFVIEQKYLEKLKKVEKDIIKLKKNLVEIVIKSSDVIENVPGVNAFILNAFAERDINLFEVMSCYTDTLLILKPEDITPAVELLGKMLKSS